MTYLYILAYLGLCTLFMSFCVFCLKHENKLTRGHIWAATVIAYVPPLNFIFLFYLLLHMVCWWWMNLWSKS